MITHLETDKHKIESIGPISKNTMPVMVSPKDLVQLFPSEALAELKDMESNANETKLNRGNATKALILLNTGEPLNASSPEFSSLLQWATVLESFSQTDIDNIMDSI